MFRVSCLTCFTCFFRGFWWCGRGACIGAADGVPDGLGCVLATPCPNPHQQIVQRRPSFVVGQIGQPAMDSRRPYCLPLQRCDGAVNMKHIQASEFMNPRLALLSLALLVALANASAVTRYVDLNSPNPTAPYTNWLTAATIIQDAVDAASADDSVLVANGVYQVGSRASVDGATNRVTVAKPIVLMSLNGSAVTLIDGGGTNRCVYLTNGATCPALP